MCEAAGEVVDGVQREAGDDQVKSVGGEPQALKVDVDVRACSVGEQRAALIGIAHIRDAVIMSYASA